MLNVFILVKDLVYYTIKNPSSVVIIFKLWHVAVVKYSGRQVPSFDDTRFLS